MIVCPCLVPLLLIFAWLLKLTRFVFANIRRDIMLIP
jgi:hypothetical protein